MIRSRSLSLTTILRSHCQPYGYRGVVGYAILPHRLVPPIKVSHFCHGLSEHQAINVSVIKLYAPVKLRATAPPKTTDNHRRDDRRAELIAKAGNRASDLSFLLGGWTGAKDAKGNLINGDKEKWKPDCSVISATLSL